MSTVKQSPSPAAEQDRDALLDRMVRAASDTFMLFGVHLGTQLGLFDELARAGSTTSTELARRTATNERYVREWLEHQTVTGILRVENPNDSASLRRYSPPEGHREVLADHESLNYLAPLAQITVGAVRPLDALLTAFRTGDGVPYEDYGVNLVEGQAGMNRAAFLHQLGQQWLRSIPDIHQRLLADPPAAVADVGCGVGWSSMGMAKCYPKIRVDGFDLDPLSVDMARLHARHAGLEDRLQFHEKDAAAPDLADKYDLVTAFECIHDLADPVSVLSAMRDMAGAEGSVIVMDENVGETFTPRGAEAEPLMYGFSVFHCLPSGMAEQPSAGTGTVMRPETLRGYARDAGFQDVEILPIDHFFFRFYRLRV